MVYLMNCNTVRNSRREELNRSQLQYLQSKYGKNWEAGVEKDSTVKRYDPDYAKRKREEISKEKEKSFKRSLKEGIDDLIAKRSISGKQADRLVNVANQI